ncbi:putative Site-specific DNA-methyltransferase (adenine-specific) [Sterolibacterium denitrificans]|uniref:site-specific DNA-methyltransferase (adenine-specific) n=1 Tax=Sterolibacterium denitrificans TaxID=157592 RepID=A0A7Z7HPR4_9PROT|nr:site-specific DNA-methyltransferase [Sterolibacterium denitrificans]SMB22532.1 putative Site-specific DNA-methyltransferase (adenine-specific) [Sterolibacterium denitrificans]
MEKLTAASSEAQSADLVAGNIAQLKALFPELITEGAGGAAINVDVLKALVGDATVTDADEKYGLNWHGKRRARQLALTPSIGTLRPCPEDSVDWDTTRNLMIEGDNLEVLKLLQKSYAGKVKLIYIDPPYNTGKDFVYPDNFQDNIKNYLELTGQVEGGQKISSNTEASGRFHTDWLNMMYPRLKLARNLLRDDGLIVVNIDDGESANLKSVMVEIFGEENFLAMISWEKRYTRSNNARLFYSLKDTLVTFRKSESVSILREARGEKSKEIYSNPDNDARGVWTSSSYVNPATKEQRPNLVYTIINHFNDEKIDHPTHAWKYEYSEHERHVREKRLWWGQSGDAKFPRLKNFLAEMDDGMVPIDLWDYKSTGTTDEGGQEVKELFGQAAFDNPKPTRLIQRLLGLSSPETHQSFEAPIILDFFAGSGTTGHAVMAQNAADGGSRRYVLVQLPEPLDPENKDQKVAVEFCDKLGKSRTIAELTKERLRRAAQSIKQRAASSEQRAASSEQRAASSEQRAASSEQRAASSEQRAASSEQRAASSEQRAASSEQRAASSEQRAASSEQRAASSEQRAASSEQRAAIGYYGKLAKFPEFGKIFAGPGLPCLQTRHFQYPRLEFEAERSGSHAVRPSGSPARRSH